MNLSCYGSRGEGDSATGLAVELIAQGKLDVKPFITHNFKLDNINEAFDTFVNRKGGAIKVIINN